MITINDIRKTYIDAAGSNPAARRQAELTFNATIRDYARERHVEMYGVVEVEPPAGYHGDPLCLRKASTPDEWTDDTPDSGTDDGLPPETAVSKWESELNEALTLVRDAKELVKQTVCDCDVEDYVFLLANAANQLQVVEETLNSTQEE